MVADLPIAGLCDDLLCHHPGSGWYGSLDAGAASNEKGMVERRTFHLISWVVGIFQPCYTPVISICVYSNVPCFSDISHSNCWTSGFRATTSFAKILHPPTLRRRLPFLVTMEAQRMLGWMGGTGGCDPKKVLWLAKDLGWSLECWVHHVMVIDMWWDSFVYLRLVCVDWLSQMFSVYYDAGGRHQSAKHKGPFRWVYPSDLLYLHHCNRYKIWVWEVWVKSFQQINVLSTLVTPFMPQIGIHPSISPSTLLPSDCAHFRSCPIYNWGEAQVATGLPYPQISPSISLEANDMYIYII